ncbi:hypothetical protein [Alicyclobacillus shizuokensis]|uniref:hypothetical protein n=1 Tax=Alicyclobacillus shizuokensis TaxID=392014 RepID=UPI0008364FA4|nr:hypothetical protein [Alicyclobacillus shizuokensis]
MKSFNELQVIVANEIKQHGAVTPQTAVTLIGHIQALEDKVRKLEQKLQATKPRDEGTKESSGEE